MIEQIEFIVEATCDAARLGATQVMPRPVVKGRVIHGNKLGRELGIPTANLAIASDSAPDFGIYAVTAILANEEIKGIASWGTRPHFDDGLPLLEVHLLDFSGNLYDAMLTVRFDHYLRPEERFANIEELITQIQNDIASARRFHQV